MSFTRFSEEHVYFTVYNLFYVPLINTATNYCITQYYFSTRKYCIFDIRAFSLSVRFVSSVEISCVFSVRTVISMMIDSIHSNARFLPYYGGLQD